MPQRFLRPGLRNSARWNSIGLVASKLYIALLTLVDDYGQYEGRASVIWSDCFTVWNELHPDEQIDLAASCCALQQLSDAFMLEIWSGSNGKKYLQVTQWQERVRDGCRPKWVESGVKYVKLQQVAASCSEILPPSPPPPPPPSSLAFAITPSPPPSDNGEGVLDCKSRIGEIFKRKTETAWSHFEDSTLCELYRRPDFQNELSAVVGAYERKTDFMSESVTKLLQDWTANLDRARNERKPNERNQNNGATRAGGSRRTDGNQGTLNDGKAHLYRDVGKVGRVQNTGRPNAGTNANPDSEVSS